MNKLTSNLCLSVLCCSSVNAFANTVSVDCDNLPPGALSAAVSAATPGTTINVSGTCHDAIHIGIDSITIVGNIGGSNSTITGFFPQDRITIDGVTGVSIIGFDIKNGVVGVNGVNNASLSLTDVNVTDNILGAIFNKATNVSLIGNVKVTKSQVFGLQVLTGSSLTLDENASMEISENFLGSQISINSTLFADTGSKMIVKDNSTIGLSINTGSTGMLFNANLHTLGNGLDGLDIVSSSNFEVDGESVVTSENNGREGISIDNSTLNMFGFFSSAAGLPKIISNGNTVNGILVESTSKLDIGRNASIEANYNGEAGVRLDDGSSAVIQRANLNNNNGLLPRDNHDHDDDKHENEHRPADVIVTFGSRISFNQEPDNAGNVQTNDIGLALCDRTSISRGDTHCKR